MYTVCWKPHRGHKHPKRGVKSEMAAASSGSRPGLRLRLQGVHTNQRDGNYPACPAPLAFPRKCKYKRQHYS